MNSRWKGNLIIFMMALVLAYSDGHIKIRVSGSLKSLSSNLVKVDENHRVAWVWCRSMKMLFWDDFDRFWLLVDPRLTRVILLNLSWNGTLSALMPKLENKLLVFFFIIIFFNFFLIFWIFTSKKISGASRSLAGPVFSFSSQLQSSVLH